MGLATASWFSGIGHCWMETSWCCGVFDMLTMDGSSCRQHGFFSIISTTTPNGKITRWVGFAGVTFHAHVFFLNFQLMKMASLFDPLIIINSL